LKQYLRLAEAHRKAGGQYMAYATNHTNGTPSSEAVGLDMERAFIEFARVKTLIVEPIPAYRDCRSGLNVEQRTNLTAVRALATSSHIYCMSSRVSR
jgi:hypothetical protein